MRFAARSARRVENIRYSRLLTPVCGLVLAAAASAGRSPEPVAQTSAAAQTLRETAQKHQLFMGAAVDSVFFPETSYITTLAREYSTLEPANEMKWDMIHPAPGRYDYSGPDALVAFAQTHSMKLRGHTRVWHRSLPDWVSVRDWMHAQNGPSVPWTPTALNKVLADHIANVVGHFKGKVYAWDVVNEPFNDDGSMRSTIWYDKPGIGFAGQGTKFVEQALIWAHATDPDAKLFVNEYGAETLGQKSDAVYAMAKDFVKRGVPLTGIGLQLHIGTDFNSLDALRRNLRRLAALGLEVQFTEVDVRLRDDSNRSLRRQAEAYKNLLDECLKEPACTLFQTWGFTDKYSWVPQGYPGYGWALPFDESYRKKPAYSAMLKELQSEDNAGPRPPVSRGVSR
jgi:endo-1,4-beta-xylanase